MKQQVSQADYQKVHRAVLAPMKAIYGVQEPEFLRIMTEDLARFGESTLDEAWALIRRTRKTKPLPAHFVEACNQILESEIDRRPKAPAYFEVEADVEYLMTGPNARQAIAMGCAADLEMNIRVGKIKADADIYPQALIQHWADACAAHEDLKRRVEARGVNTGSRLMELFRTMAAKRAEANQRYSVGVA